MQQRAIFSSKTVFASTGTSGPAARLFAGPFRRISCAALFGSTLALASALPVSAEIKGGTWTKRAPIPVAVAEVGVGEVEGKIYVVGGTEQRGQNPPTAASTLNLMYDPANDRWQE